MEGGHRELYKSIAWRENNPREKRELFKNNRTQNRQTLFCINRNIDENGWNQSTPEKIQERPKCNSKKKTPFAVKYARWKKNRDEAKNKAKKEKKPPFIRSVCPGVLPPVKPLERRAKFKATAKLEPPQFIHLNGKPPKINTKFDFSTAGPLTRSRTKCIKFVFE